MPRPETSRIAVFICASFLAVGVFTATVTWFAYFTDSRIESSGSRAEAVVLKKEVIHSAEGDSDFLVAYQFKLASGQMIYTQRHIPKSEWTALRPGQSITVMYSEVQPRRNFPASGGVTSLSAPVLVTVVFGSLAVLGGLLLYRMFR